DRPGLAQPRASCERRAAEPGSCRSDAVVLDQTGEDAPAPFAGPFTPRPSFRRRKLVLRFGSSGCTPFRGTSRWSGRPVGRSGSLLSLDCRSAGAAAPPRQIAVWRGGGPSRNGPLDSSCVQSTERGGDATAAVDLWTAPAPPVSVPRM